MIDINCINDALPLIHRNKVNEIKRDVEQIFPHLLGRVRRKVRLKPQIIIKLPKEQ